MKNLPINFSIGNDHMALLVSFEENELHNYTVLSAHHNGKDVTAFYVFCESQQECILYPQIVEAIATCVCAEKKMPVGAWSGITKKQPEPTIYPGGGTLIDVFQELGKIFRPHFDNPKNAA